ncbi:protein MpRLK-Pelle_L-LEC6 [Marchantia polymorpha subsp. ruderalis]
MTILMVLATILTLAWWSIPGIKAQEYPFHFDFQSFDASDLTAFRFLGKAELDTVSKTLGFSDPSDVTCQTSPCAGQVFFSLPAYFLNPISNKTYSFSTSFTFSLSSPMRLRTGDGFVFLLAASPSLVPLENGTFGCFPLAGKTATPIIAVEYDTSLSTYLLDMNDNHVGVNVNYADSLQAQDAGVVGIKLASGLLITSWIDYHHILKILEVRLSYYEAGGIKPSNPLLKLPIDLSGTWSQKMFVGFSTQVYQGAEQACHIYSWSFKTFIETQLPPPPPAPPPLAPEYNDTNGGNSTTWAQRTVELGKLIGVAVGAFLVIAGLCGASVGFAQFGCAVIADPADILSPEESLLIDTKQPVERVDTPPDLEENIPAETDVSASTEKPAERRSMGFGDIMFTNSMYDVPSADGSYSGDLITETAGLDSMEVAEASPADGTAEAEENSEGTVDSTRAPLHEQVATLLEAARAGVEDETEAPRFTFKELTEATDNFSESLQLGEGRYGVFYGGVLANGVQVAVKKFTRVQKQGTSEFKAEVSMLYRMQHPNLVSVLGWCKHKREYFLVYDLIPNGNLSRVVFNPGTLPWVERFKIIQNLADALEYLHEVHHTPHRNVKSTNIFLAGDDEALLGDFGLAWLMARDEEKGTAGYVAPEVRNTQELTQMTDLYSFGIVSLEILCERPVFVESAEPEAQHLLDLMSKLVVYGTYRPTVSTGGETMDGEDDPLMTLVAKLGLLCCDPDPLARPSIKQVAQCLTGEIPFPPVPKPPRRHTTTLDYTISTTDQARTSVSTASNTSRKLTSSTTDPTTSTDRAPRSDNKRESDAVVLSSEQESLPAGTGLTPSSEINEGIPSNLPQENAPRASLDPVLARKEPLVRMDSVTASDLDFSPTSAPSTSSLEQVEENKSRVQAVPAIEVEYETASTPKTKQVQSTDKIKSSAEKLESHSSTTYSFCRSLLEELISIMWTYVDPDNGQSDTLDTATLQHEERPITSDKSPGPPLRPPPFPPRQPRGPPGPPFRPPPIPPPQPPRQPRRPPPPPSPIPQPDPPFPIPGPLPRRPPPMRPPPPRGPPLPPPPRGPKALVQDSAQSVPLPAVSQKKPTSQDQRKGTISTVHALGTFSDPPSHARKASEDLETTASLSTLTAKKTPSLQSIKSKATQPEKLSTKSEINSSMSVDAPTSSKSTPPKPPSTTTASPPLSPTSDVDTRASVSTPPAKGSSSAESTRGNAKPREKPTTKTVEVSSSKSAHVVGAPSKVRSSQSTLPTSPPISPASDVDTRVSVSTPPTRGSPSAESSKGNAKPREKPTTKTVEVSSSKSAHVVGAPSKVRPTQSKVPTSSSPGTPVPSSSLDMHPRAAITTPPSMAPSHMSSKGQTKPPGSSTTKSGTVPSSELPESVEGPPKVESSQRELSLQVLPLPPSTSDLDPRGSLSMPSSKKTTTPESFKGKAGVPERSGSQSRQPSSTGESVLPQTYTDRSGSVFSSNPSTSQKQSRTRPSQPELKSSSPPTLPVSSPSLKIGKTGSLSTLSTKKTMIPVPVQGKINVQERSTSKAGQGSSFISPGITGAQNLPTLPVSCSKTTVSSSPTSIRTKPSSEVTTDKLKTPESSSGQSRMGSTVKRPTSREAKLRSSSTQPELPSVSPATGTPTNIPGLDVVPRVSLPTPPSKIPSHSESSQGSANSTSMIEQRSSDESSTGMSTTSSSITSQREPSLLSFPGSDPVIGISKSTPPTNKSWSNVAPQEKTEVAKSSESKSGASTTFSTSPVSTAPFKRGPGQPVFPPLPPLETIVESPTPLSSTSSPASGAGSSDENSPASQATRTKRHKS